ncbi:CBO0543 family protein [Metabacillus idriensis]|uniref:CBO0543 family protein n=1 Tax=Metabacillus idriensis TaxID=324768 RepID=UPI003D29CC4A
MTIIEKTDQLMYKLSDLINQGTELWKAEVVFTWRWWFGVLLTVGTWIFWCFYHNKRSRYRLLASGFFVMTISIILDSMGVHLGLWSYRFEVVPSPIAYLPYDLALMPVVVMSLIQYKPTVSPAIKAIIFGFATAYIGEPLLWWMKIYHPLNWSFSYSIPIYIIIYLLSNSLFNQKYYYKLNE